MRILKLLFLMVLAVMNVHAAGTDTSLQKMKFPGGKAYLFRIQLRDKVGTPYSLGQPNDYLSNKAIERRLRQGLSVDSTDLPVNPQYIEAIEGVGVTVVSRSKWNNSVVAWTQDTTKAGRIAQLPCVGGIKRVWVSPDSANVRRHRPSCHNELMLHDTVGVGYHGATEEQIKMLGGTKLHAEGYRGRGMTIAVLDAGFLNADVIPAFENINLAGCHNFVPTSKEEMFAASDHGTQVLSAMAINKPKVYVGTAPEASYWLLRCEDQQTEQPVEEDYWAAAAEFADSVGVDVINSSLGFHEYDDAADNYEYWQQDGKTALISKTASMLAGKGILLVNSCGNDGMSAWKKINFPADATDIISVGAVTSSGGNAAFSSLGPSADGRVKPEVVAQGSPTAVVTERGTVSYAVGTSFAAPLISGLAACLWQKHPEINVRQLIDMICRSGNNAKHPDNVFGYGVPDFSAQ